MLASALILLFFGTLVLVAINRIRGKGVHTHGE